MICLTDAGKALLRDICSVEQSEADKGQHDRSPKARHLFRFMIIPVSSVRKLRDVVDHGFQHTVRISLFQCRYKDERGISMNPE